MYVPSAGLPTPRIFRRGGIEDRGIHVGEGMYRERERHRETTPACRVYMGVKHARSTPRYTPLYHPPWVLTNKVSLSSLFSLSAPDRGGIVSLARAEGFLSRDVVVSGDCNVDYVF